MTPNSDLKNQIKEEIEMLERLKKVFPLKSSVSQYHFYKGQIFAYKRVLKTIDAK